MEVAGRVKDDVAVCVIKTVRTVLRLYGDLCNVAEATVRGVDRPQVEVQVVATSGILRLVETAEVVAPVSRVDCTCDEVHVLRTGFDAVEVVVIVTVFSQFDALWVSAVLVIFIEFEVVANPVVPIGVLVPVTLGPATERIERAAVRRQTKTVDLVFSHESIVVAQVVRGERISLS